MCAMNLAALLVVIPISLILALSFFVLLAAVKLETGVLKIFGKVVASLLWLAALIMFMSSFVPGPGFDRMPKKGMMHQKARMNADLPMAMQREQANVMAGKMDKPQAKQGKPCGNKGMIYKIE
ncbi:MAG: hypothetical protein M0Q96_04435 [Candidatus Omnitrophica bacterium]|jgi:hypothetical protein|nr:hypothetical protein [Candidatus Omnitrophota bacterium]